MKRPVTYSFEFDRRLRAGFIGCGGHAFRNIYPVLRYLPVDLVAVCDLDEDRATAFAHSFGAQRTYADFRKMLEAEELDCVFIVTGYRRDDGSFALTHPILAEECLRRGVHVWVEKPPVACLEDIGRLRNAMRSSGKQLGVGFKKAFAPANQKVRELIERSEFGRLHALSLRYAQQIPDPQALEQNTTNLAALGFLDHLGHPLSLLQMLAGRAMSLFYTRADDGSGFVSISMRSGATAMLALTPIYTFRSLAERTEVFGDRGMVVCENNTRVTFYQRPESVAYRRRYGRDAHLTADDDAALVWEPEWSLGQLYNKGIFLLGYYDELSHFCDALLAGRPVEVGGIDYAEEGIRIYEAFRLGPNRQIELDSSTVSGQPADTR